MMARRARVWAPLLALASGVLIAGCGSSPSGGEVSFAGSAYPNGDAANTRHSGGPIDSSSVSELELAWTLPLAKTETSGAYSASPVISGGVLYAQGLGSDVLAIELESGEALWRRRLKEPDEAPNGLSVAGRRVYGTTPTSAFALDRRTGRRLWSAALTRGAREEIAMAPGHHGSRVYVSTAPVSTGPARGGGAGVLWALDARTGKRLWRFDTVPRGLWGNARVNYGGGLRYPPAFDGGGSLYVGVGGPGPVPGADGAPWGSSRPGPNLYTNSIVKLDERTGEREWHYQLTPHDVFGWDLQGPPILAEAGGRRLVLAAGKAGIAIALDPATGELVWRRPLGRHNGHDEYGRYAMRGEDSKLKDIPTLYPGSNGGVIAPMSIDGSRLFAPVVNHPISVPESGTELRGYSRTNLGELVALDVSNGKLQWSQEFREAPLFGATTSVNDLVFATTYLGEVAAFEASSGRRLWRSELPAGTRTGVAVSGDTVVAFADAERDTRVPGVVLPPEGEEPAIVAYRLGG
ncbi:MAG: PQQ-binding-like beta-propeller repeat protein [Thermoleophilaceae bacterium]